MTGSELRAIREAHNLSQPEFARLLHYHPNYIYRLERDKAPISQRFELLVIATFPKKNVRKSSMPT